MRSFLQDVRYGLRMLRQAPGFTAVAVVALGLGIGANTAIFSVLNAVLLRELPLGDPEQIVALWEYDRIRGTEREGFSPPDFFDLREQSGSFEHLAAQATALPTLTGAGEPERLRAARVSANLFPLLGVEPLLGRGFLAEEEQRGQDRVVLLGSGLWTRRFGADPTVVGRAIVLDGGERISK